jgi:hypothetical protein
VEHTQLEKARMLYARLIDQDAIHYDAVLDVGLGTSEASRLASEMGNSL